MNEPQQQIRVTVAEALATRFPEGQRSVQLLAHGSMRVLYYAPRGVDRQTPHTQDELYVVIQGNGWFVNGDRRERFGPGDVLFVAASAVHRFEEFTDDFGAWVFFYGPEGGEASQQEAVGPPRGRSDSTEDLAPSPSLPAEGRDRRPRSGRQGEVT